MNGNAVVRERIMASVLFPRDEMGLFKPYFAYGHMSG